MNAQAIAHASVHASFKRADSPGKAHGADGAEADAPKLPTGLSFNTGSAGKGAKGPAAQAAAGAGMVGASKGGVSGGGPLGRVLNIDLKNVLLYGTVGAIAAMVIPPLAPLGAVGGALLGVAVSILG